MIAIVVLVAALLCAAALLALARIVRGPTLLDRVVAAEMLLSVLIGALGAEAAINRHATTLPILLALAMLGFVGSVAMARFAAGEQS